MSSRPIIVVDEADLPSFDEIKNLLTPEEKAELHRLVAHDKRIFFPTPGPQYMAFTSEADIIGYGGAAGGGKTYLISGLALTAHKKSVIFRQNKNQTRKFVQDFTEMLGSSDGYSSQNSEWKYDGRLIEFGGLEDPGDYEKWQGRDHDLKAYDEATQMREFDVRYTMGWNRSADPNQRCRTLLTFNPPTTAEGRWVVRFFAPWLDPLHRNPAKDGELRWFSTVGDNEDYEVDGPEPFIIERTAAGYHLKYDFDPADYRDEDIIRPKSRTFITARVTDNPYYVASGYIQTLQMLPEPLRSQMLKGDFMAGVEDDEKQLIPTAWVEAAMERWKDVTSKADWRTPEMAAMGVDAARGGNMGGTTGAVGRDKMVIALRHDSPTIRFYPELVVAKGVDVNTGNLAAAKIIAHRKSSAPVQLDVAAIGTSVLDALQENNIHTVPLNGAAQSTGRDRSGVLKFSNRRAEFHWRMREALDPEAEVPTALPPDPELLADLTAPRWTVKSNGIVVEPKADIKKRIGRSPDRGEAVMYANIDTPKRDPSTGMYSGLPRVLQDRLTGASSYDENRLKELG
jgi:hypothetical protein